jgi:hypothetical protein
MPQCTAFTVKHRRCVKDAKEKTCVHHATYYDNWLNKHPPPVAFRLQLDEKEEYKFQIEGKHVEVTQAYVQSMYDMHMSDYYEYLLQLPHLPWDCNLRMVYCLILNFLRQPEWIAICRLHMDDYFGNMFRNPSFHPPIFLKILLTLMDKRQTNRKRACEILQCILHHPAFEGCMYMSWIHEIREDNPYFEYFEQIATYKQGEWRRAKQKANVHMQDIEEIAMQPERVLDWYLDWERRDEIAKVWSQISRNSRECLGSVPSNAQKHKASH